LVAQDDDLELALTAAAGEQTNETAEEAVQQTGQQDAQSEPLRPSPPAPPSRPNRVSLPHRLRCHGVGDRRLPVDLAGVPGLGAKRYQLAEACLADLVANPRPCEAGCRTVEHMRLANAPRRLVEVAET
jgi:hypothetical protein